MGPSLSEFRRNSRQDKDVNIKYLPVVILPRTETSKHIKVSGIKFEFAIKLVSRIKSEPVENWLVG